MDDARTSVCLADRECLSNCTALCHSSDKAQKTWGTLIIRHREGPLAVLLQEPYNIGLGNGVVVLDGKICRALDR